MAAVLVRAFSLLVFNGELQEVLIMIALFRGVHVKFMSDTRTLVLGWIWAMHMVIQDVKEPINL